MAVGRRGELLRVNPLEGDVDPRAPCLQFNQRVFEPYGNERKCLVLKAILFASEKARGRRRFLDRGSGAGASAWAAARRGNVAAGGWGHPAAVFEGEVSSAGRIACVTWKRPSSRSGKLLTGFPS